MKLHHKIEIGIIIVLIILPLVYLIYDRSLIPPATEYHSPPYVPGETWEQYATRFLESSKQPNALEHYLKAFSLYTSEPVSLASYEIDSILKFEWTQPYPKAEEALRLNQPALDELIRGARMKQCELPPAYEGFGFPYPDYNEISGMNRLLITAGKKMEKTNHPRIALEYYLAGLQFGNDIAQKDQIIFFQAIGLGSIRMMNYQIRKLITQQKLLQSDYQSIIIDFGRIDQKHSSFGEAFKCDRRIFYTRLYHATAEPFKDTKEFGFLTSVYIFFNRGKILQTNQNFSAELLSAITTKSYQDFMHIEWNKKWPKDLINRTICHIHFSDYAYNRITISSLRLAQIEAAIQISRLEKKRWPKGLNDLKPYVSPIPVDPFDDKPFLWAMDSTSKPFAYSVGPDFKDDAAKITYDPTNGTTSKGDIIP
ncbi:MAG: hypothetical protein ACE14V_02880 [bacterium]